MKRFLQFFALTSATQFCLLVQQVLILPLMVRLWGGDLTAAWFVAIAIANLASVFDLGVRNAGHTDLVAGEQGHPRAARAFGETWALARLLIGSLTVLCLLAQAVLSADPWLAGKLTVATALETTLVVRGTWFDTLGAFSRVEIVYLTMMVVRIVAMVLGLTVLQVSPQALAWIMVVTAGLALWGQSRLLRSPALALSAGGFGAIRWRSFLVIRYVAAEPATNWMRLSLPVLVLASFTPPTFVTLFVALRAVFGLARQVVGQLARYASVQYVQRIETAPSTAHKIAMRAILGSTLIGVAVSSIVLADHGRALRVWLGHELLNSDGLAVSFSVGAIAYGYQVASGVMTRSGDVTRVARRHYVYLLFAAGTAVLVRFAVPSVSLYLTLLGLQELLIAGLFIPVLGQSTLRVFAIAAGAAGLVLGALLATVQFGVGGVFDQITPSALAISGSLALASTLAALGVMVILDAPSSALSRRRMPVKVQ